MASASSSMMISSSQKPSWSNIYATNHCTRSTVPGSSLPFRAGVAPSENRRRLVITCLQNMKVKVMETEKREREKTRVKKEKPPHVPLDQRWMFEQHELDGPDIWNTTWYPKAADHVNTDKPWYIVDAKDKILGRLASTIAIHIRGKNLATYTPSVDMGAFVIVVNADKVAVSGKKSTQKLYRRHSGRPGGMTIETFAQLQQRIPERIIEHAVKGMLPKGRLGRRLFHHLKVYKGPDHPHEAQQPIDLPIRDKRIQK